MNYALGPGGGVRRLQLPLAFSGAGGDTAAAFCGGLPRRSHELGAAPVANPRIEEVGFTGSRAGGLALDAIAQGRTEPIPGLCGNVQRQSGRAHAARACGAR